MAVVRPPNKLLTLLFVLDRKASRVLLGLKKRGFAEGRWNGFGGKVQQGETVEEAAKRETLEECGLSVSDLDKVGVIIFEFLNDPQLLEVHVFRTDQYTGEVTESEEMKPQWFCHSDIPYKEMWPDDIMWYPHMLSSKYFDAYYKYQGHDIILESSMTEKTADHRDR